MFLFFLACSTKVPGNTASSSLDSTQLPCSYLQEKENCLGKITRVTGTVPQTPHAHPIIPTNPDQKTTQSYIQVEDQQLIVLVELPIDCAGTIELTGVLNEIDLGGPEGTRSSYKNYYFSQSTVYCLP